MTDLAQFLRDRYTEQRQAEEQKRTLPPMDNVEFRFDQDGDHVLISGYHRVETEVFMDEHSIPDADPGVLADLDAKLALVDDLTAERHDVVDDSWCTCSAATEEDDGGETCDDARRGGPCDCGRDTGVQRRLHLLAQPFVGHPEYRPEWAP